MHEIKIRVLHKIYMQVFKKLHTTIMPRLAKMSESSQRDHYKITSK
jgi:hypothetical protein